MELVVIQGQGARGQLKINDKIPGVDSLLLFELKSNHLSDCNSKPFFYLDRFFPMYGPDNAKMTVVTLGGNH